MAELLQRKKKKKRKDVLLTGFDCLEEEDVIRTIKQIREKLRLIFKNHIGEENSISPVELFQLIYGENTDYLDIFRKNYWWEVIKGCLRQLRSEGTLFVINKRTKLFVLQSEEEAEEFKKRIDRDIAKMKEVKIKADDWVKYKRWKKLSEYNGNGNGNGNGHAKKI